MNRDEPLAVNALEALREAEAEVAAWEHILKVIEDSPMYIHWQTYCESKFSDVWKTVLRARNALREAQRARATAAVAYAQECLDDGHAPGVF